MPISPSSSPPQTLGSLLDKLYEVLETPAVRQEKELRLFLEDYSQTLLSEDPHAPLSSKYFTLANSITRLLDQTGKVRRVVAQSLLAKENTKKGRKKIRVVPSSASTSLPSCFRLSEPKKAIRFLLSIPSSIPSTYTQKEQPVVVTDKVVNYLDGRSATQLLTSCGHLKAFSLTQALYAPLLRRDFPALYGPLANSVSTQTKAHQGLLWRRLYAMCYNPQPQVLKGHTNVVTCLTQLEDGRIASGSYDHTVRVWPLNGSVPTVLKGHTGPVTCLTQLADGRLASGGTHSDKTVRIWPLDGSIPTVLTGYDWSTSCLAQLADGRIASGGSLTIRIWGKDLTTLFQLALGSMALTAKPQGRRFHFRTVRRLATLAKAITIMKKAAT